MSGREALGRFTQCAHLNELELVERSKRKDLPTGRSRHLDRGRERNSGRAFAKRGVSLNSWRRKIFLVAVPTLPATKISFHWRVRRDPQEFLA